MPLRRFLTFTAIAVVAVYLLVVLALRPALEALGFPAPDVSGMRQLIEGNTMAYLLFLLPVSWGSAAFGEEMLVRGFILNRAERLTHSAVWAVVIQATIFGLAHSYQGITGMLMIFTIGLILGAVFIRCGRNLWPVIVAHGVIDTIGITALYLGWGIV